MKKLLSTILFISIALFANAYDFMVDGLCYNINSDGISVSVTSGIDYSGVIDIPSSVSYNGTSYQVTTIGHSAFYNKRIESVNIGNSVKIIESDAFMFCTSLSSVHIPESVSIVRSGAFDQCYMLENIHIDNIRSWCEIVFGNSYANPLCQAWGSLYLNGEKLTHIDIPEQITKIGSYAFYGCSSLISVSIPNSVVSIGNGAFQNCKSLTGSFIIPNSVTSIGSCAFYGCSALTSATIGSSVTIICGSAFQDCTSLTSVTVGNSVDTIGGSAFSGCTSLNLAILGDNVKYIGNNAFKGCSFLENLVALRERPILINSNVFEGVPKASCDLHVRQGSKIRYENQDVWKDFLIIVEDAEDWADVGGGGSSTGVYGDVNGDGQVTAADVTAVYDVLLGK